MYNSFSRTQSLIGENAFNKLKNARIIIFGVGGVGGYTVEALARTGIGDISLVDNDVVSETNINRQIIATNSNIGKPKVLLFKERILDINPDCKVTCHQTFFGKDNSDTFDFTSYDYVIDAIDTVSSKIELAVICDRLNVPIISAMGAGNKLDATAFKVSDIYKTKVCPLAKVMRRELKCRNVKKLKVVYSEEEPIKVQIDEDGESKKRIAGSISYVPSTMGLIIAGEVIKDLIK